MRQGANVIERQIDGELEWAAATHESGRPSSRHARFARLGRALRIHIFLVAAVFSATLACARDSSLDLCEQRLRKIGDIKAAADLPDADGSVNPPYGGGQLLVYFWRKGYIDLRSLRCPSDELASAHDMSEVDKSALHDMGESSVPEWICSYAVHDHPRYWVTDARDARGYWWACCPHHEECLLVVDNFGDVYRVPWEELTLSSRGRSTFAQRTRLRDLSEMRFLGDSD